MKTSNNISKKRIYSTPLIVRVKLDNEISLALESDAPIGPGEGFLKAPEYFNNDTFKNNVG